MPCWFEGTPFTSFGHVKTGHLHRPTNCFLMRLHAGSVQLVLPLEPTRQGDPTHAPCPSEYPLKPWPFGARSGDWQPVFREVTTHASNLVAEPGVTSCQQRRCQTVGPFARIGASLGWRPLGDQQSPWAEVAGGRRGVFFTPHFSGATTGRASLSKSGGSR